MATTELRREQKRLAAARYRAAHPGRQRENSARYRAKHPEKVRKKNQRWLQRLREEAPERSLLYNARARAKKGGYPCTIELSDIVIPERCPILGVPLVVGIGRSNSPNSPTLDKINPKVGYVPGNIQVISRRANTMKNDATEGELVAFAKWVLGRQQ